MTAFPKGRLEASEEMFIPGRSMACVSPDEQVENTAESSWNDLAKQRTLNQALVCLQTRGWEDIRERPPIGRAQEQPKGVLRVNEETG